MVKRIIIIIFIFLSINLFSLEENIYNLFKINIPNLIKITKKNEYIKYCDNSKYLFNILKIGKTKNKYFVYIDYLTENNNKFFFIQIALQVKDKIDLNDLKNITNINNEENIFQIGGTKYNISINEKYGNGTLAKIDTFNVKNIEIKKIIDSYGGQMARDTLSYNFYIHNNNIFEECRIDFFNVWPENVPFDSDLSYILIDKKIKENDKNFYLYELIDKMIKNIIFIE